MTTTPCCSTSTASSPRRPSCTSMRGRRCSPSTSTRKGIDRLTPTPTTSPTSMASHAMTASVRCLPRAASSCLRATRPTPRPRRRSAVSATARTRSSRRCLPHEGVEPYPGSVALMDDAGGAGRRDGRGVELEERARRAGCGRYRRAVRRGRRRRGRASQGLKGKPSGETYTYAASLLEHQLARTVVVEDALSGVAAGRDGGFGLVVGVDRGAGRDALVEQGADVVVEDLAELVTR